MVIDDALMLGANVVQVLQYAPEHKLESAIDAQVQCGLGKGAQDAAGGLVNDLVYTLDELVDQLLVVLAILVALGKNDIGLGHRLFQMLEKEIGYGIRIVRNRDIAHNPWMLAAVILNGLADFAPVAGEDTTGHIRHTLAEDFTCMFGKIGI